MHISGIFAGKTKLKWSHRTIAKVILLFAQF